MTSRRETLRRDTAQITNQQGYVKNDLGTDPDRLCSELGKSQDLGQTDPPLGGSNRSLWASVARVSGDAESGMWSDNSVGDDMQVHRHRGSPA